MTKGVAPPPPRVSKPQQFATAAEAAGWSVTRMKEGRRRTVVAVRGDEAFEFEWVRNAETGRDNFVRGEHRVEAFTEEWVNVRAATRVVEAPPQAYRVIEEEEGVLSLLRLPFDIATATDEAVLDGLADQAVVWRNNISGGIEKATCPARTSAHFRVEVRDSPEARIVHLTDATLDNHSVVGTFRAFRLSALLGVK